MAMTGSRSEGIMRTKTASKSSLGAVLAMLLLGIPCMILKAWVLQHLWTWFVKPTFHIPTPKIAVIYGLAWFVSLLWPWKADDEDVNAEYVTKYVFVSVWLSLCGLLVGAVAHAFV